MVQKEEMDILYFKKYARYVKQNANSKSAINLFLTLKKCRKSCYIHFSSRYKKSFLHILNYYKMHYEMKKEDNHIFYLISQYSIPEEVKHVFHHSEDDIKNPHIMGKFLGYPAFMNVRRVSKMKEIGSIGFYFMKNKKEKKKEIIYGFRIPNAKITPEMIAKMNILMKKYRKCIQKYLGILFPELTIEMNIQLNP
jgi:hypothetical protein